MSALAALRGQIERAFSELGLDALVPQEAMQRDLSALEIRVGTILADVALAELHAVPLHEAVHRHEEYPYLARAHGSIRDLLNQEIPQELLPLATTVLRRPPPNWAPSFRDNLCVVARSVEATTEERALCRLLVFEAVWLNLFIAARNTNGRFEGTGAADRDIELAAGETLEKMLAVPLQEDGLGEFRPFHVTYAAAMSRLHDHMNAAWRAQCDRFAADGRSHELLDIFEMRVRAEMLIRSAPPVVEALLRNQLESDRALHLQPIPVARLRLEHPLILGDLSEGALNTRACRARQDLATDSKACSRRKTTVLDLLIANWETV